MTRLADRVKEVTSTTGTGPKTLAGAVTGFRPFLATLGAGGVYYCEVHQTLAEWEVGVGTLSASPNTLTTSSILASSNAGAAVNFSAGLKDIFCTLPAAVAGATPLVSKEYVSAAQTITLNTTLTLAHGFGAIPKLAQIRIKCVTTDQGWAVGDEVVMNPGSDYFGQAPGNSSINFVLALDGTNLTVLIGGNNLLLVNKSTRLVQSLAIANWQLYVRAWA